MKRLILFKERNIRSGGKEIYVERLSDALDRSGIANIRKHSKIPLFLPSWVRQILFNIQICLFKNKKDILISFERIICPDIYRAGDGVHKEFLKLQKKSILNPLHFILLKLEEKCFKSSKIIIANSALVRNQIIKNYQISRKKIKVIYNGIELKPTADDNLTYLQETYNTRNKTVFLFVGSGFERKGLKSFLNILYQLNSNDFVAFVVGKDKRLNEYVKYSKDLGLSDKVFFMGLRDDVINFYRVSDFFILPTKYDPFSNVVLEAMFYKNIVITTQNNGASEIINPAHVMSSEDDLGIINTINEIVSSKKLLKEIKFKNHNIASKFSIDKNMEQTINILKSL
jgi:UDP-glucose:(heptosyl)LPS alpha-1,3-glucosyltransferase